MEFTSNDIHNIAFDKINDRFSRGKYLGIEVTMDMTNGYINGNHLVNQVVTKGGQPKRFDNWKRGKEAQEIMAYLESPQVRGDPNQQPKQLLIEVLDVPNELKGTYVDPVLVGHLAQWASPILAHKVLEIVKRYVIDAAVAEKNQTIQMIRAENKELMDKVDAQSAQIAQLLTEVRAGREENGMVLQQLDTITAELEVTSLDKDNLTTEVETVKDSLETTKASLETTKANLETTKASLETVKDKVVEIAAKLDIATDQRVPPPSQPKCEEVFAVYHNPTSGKYYMIRRQKRTIAAGITNCIRNGFTDKVFYSDSPNAVNLDIRIKDIFPVILGTVSGTIITLRAGKTSADLLEYITWAEQQKKNV